jgi:hypothetical protein
MSTMNTASDVINYIEGGHGSLTIKSLKTGRHFTYRFRAPKGNNNVMFVKFLADGDQWIYLGMIATSPDGWVLLATKASPAKVSNTTVFKALEWSLYQLQQDHLNDLVFDWAEFRHDGSCCRCGRTLTTPESIDRGIGPVCAEKAAA